MSTSRVWHARFRTRAIRLDRLDAAAAAAILCLGSGCAISYNMPAHRFDSPEAQGRPGRVRIDLGVGGNNTVQLTDDFIYRAPDPANPVVQRDNGDPRYALSVSLADRLDVDLKNALAGQPMYVQAKYQLLGEPRAKAGAGNTSLSATIAGGYLAGKGSGTQLFGGSTVRYSLGVTSWDGALVAGYRPTEGLLLYGGAAITTFSSSGDREVIATGGTSTTTPFGGTSAQRTAHLGLELGKPASGVAAKVELAIANGEAGPATGTHAYLGAAISFFF